VTIAGIASKCKEEAVSSRTAIIILAFCSIVPVCAIQQTPSAGSQATASQANLAATAERAQLQRFTPADEAKALENDIRKMRAVDPQMKTTLPFVNTTQSPLKHQFQLEIDAGTPLIDQMQRHAQASTR